MAIKDRVLRGAARARTAEIEQGDAEPSASADVRADAPAGTATDLVRRAHAALEARGEPLDAETLARAVFGARGALAGGHGPWVAILDDLLRRAPAFRAGAGGTWRLAVWDKAQQPLGDVEFVALDVETTGLAPGRHRLIEVAAVVVRDGQIGAHFQRLVNPARRIPQFITRFTGISEAMVARSAPAERVLPRLHAFIAGRPIIGHNVGFDLGFLSYEGDRCRLAEAFPLEGVDTIALARRYLTGMRRARLDAVASVLHVPVRARHRALADALLTAQVFALLLARAREEGCATLDDLWRAVRGAAPSRASVPPVRPTGSLYLNPAWRQSFSTRPGVYLMKDAAGVVIYVGKAKCLRDRLASYYSQPLGYARKMDGLLQHVHSIETRVLGSELEALLTESRLIKELQPCYNVQLRNYEIYPFIKVDVQHAYPRVYATREVAADGARYFGPFRSERIVAATIELIHRVFPLRTCTRSLPPAGPAGDPCLRYHLKRCPAPCRGPLVLSAGEQYRAAVREACAFLGGERDDLLARLKREMYDAAARQDFERAARLRDALRDADLVLLGQRLITGAVEANNVLIIYPSADDGCVEIFLVRHGRLARQARVLATGAALEPEVRALVAEAACMGAPPAQVGREEVDAINIIARWIHRHSEEDERAFFSLPLALADAGVVGEFARRVAQTVLAREPAAGDEHAGEADASLARE